MSPPEIRRSQFPGDDGRCPQRKSVLFCPDCGHESLVDGDWTATDDYLSGARRLRCPDCSTVITDRPLPTDSLAGDAPSPDTVVAGPFARSFGTVTRLWQDSMRHWVQWSRRMDA